jgi:hypothetical protein
VCTCTVAVGGRGEKLWGTAVADADTFAVIEPLERSRYDAVPSDAVGCVGIDEVAAAVAASSWATGMVSQLVPWQDGVVEDWRRTALGLPTQTDIECHLHGDLSDGTVTKRKRLLSATEPDSASWAALVHVRPAAR